MTQALTNEQLMTLMQSGPLLDSISPALSPSLQQQLLEVQKRAGNAYAGVDAQTPMREELQQALGQAYLALDDKKSALKSLMDALELTPSATRKNWVEQVVDNVKGWFR